MRYLGNTDDLQRHTGNWGPAFPDAHELEECVTEVSNTVCHDSGSGAHLYAQLYVTPRLRGVRLVPCPLRRILGEAAKGSFVLGSKAWASDEVQRKQVSEGWRATPS